MRRNAIEIWRVIREELQQVMCEEPQQFDSFWRRLRNHIGILLVLIVVEVETHNISARLTQTGNGTMSVI